MKFMEYIAESINDVGIFKAIFMAGQSLAGKSYVISKVSNGKIDPRIVNTDKMLEFLQTKGTPDLEKVKLLTKEQLVLYINSLLPLFIDSTSSNPNALIRRQGILSSLGYDTGMIFVNCSLETSIKRLELRARKVPPELIEEKYNEIEKLKPFYKTKFGFYEEIDNDEGELTDDVVKKAFKQVSSFFTEQLANPLGIKVVKKMKDNNWKYMFDGIHDKEYIEKLVSVWYRH